MDYQMPIAKIHIPHRFRIRAEWVPRNYPSANAWEEADRFRQLGSICGVSSLGNNWLGPLRQRRMKICRHRLRCFVQYERLRRWQRR